MPNCVTSSANVVQPYELANPEGRAPLLLVCDHAANYVPAALDGLGLAPADLARHIALDLGAGELTRRLARRLDAPAVLATVSRLVIDLNRHPTEADSIPEISDGTAIPGNQGLAARDRTRRVEAIFRPYHGAIGRALDRLRRLGPPPLLVALHSFTPSLNGIARPWPVGILWNQDDRLARFLIDGLGRAGAGPVGDNQPYSGQMIAYTMNTHAGQAGLAHAGIEVRQDELADEAGLARWTDRLAPLLALAADQAAFHRWEAFG
ncbi:MAG: N-formylglutamate amidohydrolase [Rhodospirillales bacterium]|nr:N-formylglutamate amidohydrolase [Rhodospirillales bacterium]